MKHLSRLFRPGAARRLAARFGILALLLQCFVFAAHMPVMAALPYDPAAWCGDVTPDFGNTGPQAPHKVPPCPLCNSLQAAGTALPSSTAFEIVQFAVYAPPVPQVDVPAPERLTYRPANSRAPPASV